MNLIFCIPVHEAPECVEDLIHSILCFYPEALIILHTAKKCDQRFIFAHPNVQTVHFCETGYLDGSLAYTYYKLFEYIKMQGVIFDKLIFCGSNEIFISGLHLEVSGRPFVNDFNKTLSSVWYDIASKYFGSAKLNSINPEGYFVYQEDVPEILKICKRHFGLFSYIIYSTPLGLLLRRGFSRPFRKYSRFTPRFLLKFTFPLEEFLFQNVGKYPNSNGNPLCYCNWANNLELTIDEVRSVNRNKYASVKRVPRKFDDQIRKYLRNERSNISTYADL